MDQMGWQKHTVRGFMAGAMKKAGYVVESFQSDSGERTYWLCGAPHNAEDFKRYTKPSAWRYVPIGFHLVPEQAVLPQVANVQRSIW
jgi:hypothetical protein